MRQLKITKSITNREQGSLDKYLLEIAQYDLISPEEEVRLAQQIKAGSTEALERLTKANLRFVVSVAKQYQNQGLALPDLINEGNFGLMKAAKRFDDTKGFKFISYAVRWIRQSILAAIAEEGRMVKLPLNRIGTINKMRNISSAFEVRKERPATEEELAELLEIPLEKLRENLIIGQKHSSIAETIAPESDITKEDGLVSEDPYLMPDSVLVVEGLKLEIEKSLSTLNEKESLTLHMYFGLNGRKPQTLDEIATKLDLNRERARQIKDRAIRRLKNSHRSANLKPYLG